MARRASTPKPTAVLAPLAALLVGALWWWCALRLVLAPGGGRLREAALLAGSWGLSLLPVHVTAARARGAAPDSALPRGDAGGAPPSGGTVGAVPPGGCCRVCGAEGAAAGPEEAGIRADGHGTAGAYGGRWARRRGGPGAGAWGSGGAGPALWCWARRLLRAARRPRSGG
ncbi:hypothetical protein ACFVIM_12950 [Streptomyces sp. NPDC057638]|uniref:hypothetical protein n=1 Tax=Streptomyces sp. NPDC057638 TaxID=3346190 RepID=UPI0036D04588